MKKFVVYGNPIKQSLSPVIHNDFALQANIKISYEKQLSQPEIFKTDLASFFEQENAVGCNVTAPFKEQAYQFADQAFGTAKDAKAANTLHSINGHIEAHNTDGPGLVNDVTRLIGSISGSRILLLGAGGAARGVMRTLLDQGVESLTIANRTIAKANDLVSMADSNRIFASTLSELNDSFDIVINSTSASLSGNALDLGGLKFNGTTLTYDMSYKAEQTPFLVSAQQQGSRMCADGLGMLIGQAAVSFTIWTGFEPDTESLIKTLRQGMLA
ncbi:shikimate dehydrogenase [Alteromonas sp. 5E99-2]|uniref:shikimate dehydrogenase n=1 Tax=Alteromonas sp. 5E99-2 TaxID=2817683 RepID=UPI001A990DFD|nr:shikimate dehydrogenase [Alteromonas sp. 5E99-2]MBO1256815.1 shikimate dehydrogenase [Alteromonas sp. 5E99-2]